MNKDRKKNVYSDSSISEATTFFPMSTTVKKILKVRADRKAGMPDFNNVETIVAIPRPWVYDERDWFVEYCEKQIGFL